MIESVIGCSTAKRAWEDLILNFEGPSEVKENRVMDLKHAYNTFKHIEDEIFSQIITIYKVLMNELVNDGNNLSNQEFNIGFVNSLPKKMVEL